MNLNNYLKNRKQRNKQKHIFCQNLSQNNKYISFNTSLESNEIKNHQNEKTNRNNFDDKSRNKIKTQFNNNKINYNNFNNIVIPEINIKKNKVNYYDINNRIKTSLSNYITNSKINKNIIKFNTHLNNSVEDNKIKNNGVLNFNDEVEYMNMKLNLKVLEHKLSKLTNIIMPEDEFVSKFINGNNFNFNNKINNRNIYENKIYINNNNNKLKEYNNNNLEENNLDKNNNVNININQQQEKLENNNEKEYILNNKEELKDDKFDIRIEDNKNGYFQKSSDKNYFNTQNNENINHLLKDKKNKGIKLVKENNSFQIINLQECNELNHNYEDINKDLNKNNIIKQEMRNNEDPFNKLYKKNELINEENKKDFKITIENVYSFNNINNKKNNNNVKEYPINNVNNNDNINNKKNLNDDLNNNNEKYENNDFGKFINKEKKENNNIISNNYNNCNENLNKNDLKVNCQNNINYDNIGNYLGNNDKDKEKEKVVTKENDEINLEIKKNNNDDDFKEDKNEEIINKLNNNEINISEEKINDEFLYSNRSNYEEEEADEKNLNISNSNKDINLDINKNINNNNKDNNNGKNNKIGDDKNTFKNEDEKMNILLSQISPYKEIESNLQLIPEKEDKIPKKSINNIHLNNISLEKSNKNFKKNNNILNVNKKDKKVTFDENLIYINYDEDEYVTNLLLTDNNGRNIPFKEKDFSKYLRLLTSVSHTSKLKPAIIDLTGKNKKKKKTKIMKRNMEFIKEVEKTGNVFSTSKERSKKIYKLDNMIGCRKFLENPQQFFTEDLCDAVLLSYNLEPKENKSRGQVKMI